MLQSHKNKIYFLFIIYYFTGLLIYLHSFIDTLYFVVYFFANHLDIMARVASGGLRILNKAEDSRTKRNITQIKNNADYIAQELSLFCCFP
jgi:NhaP-type Na+/H+ or K+/H+ antiporter